MSSCPRLATLVCALLLAATGAFAQGKAGFPGIGRAATPQEVAAWDIDVRPDFKGLLAGSGSVAKGQEVWESKCASCHGVFGESNEVFNPLVGGTTAEDIKTGRVASLRPGGYPDRTTLMKVSSVATLWDYINRAMPWTQPKTLTVEEVYASTAYLLHLGGVLPADYTLSDKNIREVQQRLPNRNGVTTAHALWPGKEFGSHRPDVAAQACMKNCPVETKVASILPDFARTAHGNLAEQNRGVGPQRGVDTTASAQSQPQVMKSPDSQAASTGRAAHAIAQKNSCTACHAANTKLVGPSWTEIAQKHEGKIEYLAGKIRAGGSGAWGAIPMPPQSLSEADARTIAAWLASGAKP